MRQINRWVYAITGIITLLLAGMIYAWSVLGRSIGAAYPEWTAAQLSLTFTTVMICFSFGGLFAGFMAKRVKPRAFLILAGIVFFIGFNVAALAQTPPVLYLGIGVFCGLGSGLAYNAVISTVNAWFPDRQGLVSGLMLMGFGLSSMLFGKVFAAIAPADGSDAWRGAFRLFGIVLILVMAAAGLILKRPGTDFVPPAGAGRKVRASVCEMTPGQMLRTPVAWIFFAWVVLMVSISLTLISQASGIAAMVGPTLSDSSVATIAGVISIFNGIGRVVGGILYDRKGYRPTMIVVMALYLLAGLSLFAALNGGLLVCVISGFAAAGFSAGGVAPVISSVTSEFFGRENYAINFSLFSCNPLIASFSSTIAGRLYDATGSYVAVVWMILGLSVSAILLSLGVRSPKKS